MDLAGATAVFLGDSITEGAFASPENVYYKEVARILGLKRAIGYGRSGTRIARQTVPMPDESRHGHFILRVPLLAPDADLAVVFGGVNDFGHGDAPFGCEGDRTSDTFCGACRELFTALTDKYGKERVAVITPLKCSFENDPLGDGRKSKPGRLLKDYAAQIKKCAEGMDIKVIDLYNDSELDPCAEEGAGYFADGLHPNDMGHKLLGQKIASAIISM